MDTNNYIGSVAQENVAFQTVVVENSTYGENFKRVMLFADYNLISDTTYLMAVDGSTTLKAATVTADDYASVVTGIAQSWLTDLFASGETEEAYVIVDTSGSMTTEIQETAYGLLKAHAYWKVPCVCVQAGEEAGADVTTLDATRFNTLASALADLCYVDRQVLSGPVPVPLSTTDATMWAADDRYLALKDKFVFMSYYEDATRNLALFSIGLALSTTNSSGTPVGNSLCFTKTNGVTANKANKAVRAAMNAANIQTWKPVGDNSKNVIAEVELDLLGNTIPALWMIAYVTYIAKVRIAVLMAVPNFYRTEENYNKILDILLDVVKLFEGRLSKISLTAPAFDDLDGSDPKRLEIPNAWKAHYVDTVTDITISGTLYLGEE